MSQPALKKKLGQHHLTRPEICLPLVRFVEPEGRLVYEIGPGGGILTELLIESGASVCGLELDRAWAFELRQRGLEFRAGLAVADALSVSWNRLPSASLVVGNLPYQIAATLIARLVPLGSSIERMGFLVQLEVAERLTARPGGKDYGALSVLVQSYTDCRILGRVGPGSFRPPPKVESAFVGLTTQPPPLPEAEMPDFVAMVRLAFGQRRKTVRNALSAEWSRDRAEAALAEAGIDPRTRAENLELGDFLELYRADT